MDVPASGTAFVNVGRAWGGESAHAGKKGWLGIAGDFGLRLFSARTAFSNVVHIDLAFPFDANTSVKRMQLLAKPKDSC